VKYLVWLVSACNLWFGGRAFLNAIGILQTSKYSQATTVLFALLFLGLGIAGFYVAIVRDNPRLALLIAVGPWALAMVVLFITMVTSSHQ
jgi:hypothetical protein